LLAIKAGKLRGKLTDNEVTQLLNEFEYIPNKIEQILKEQELIQKFSSQ